MINNTTKSKATYIKLWFSHIDSLNLLLFTNDKEARESIRENIRQLKINVLKIADSKGLTDSKEARELRRGFIWKN